MTANPDFIEQVQHLYKTYGDRHYGEGCTQYEHMAQCGWWADHKDYDEAMVLAAFLHDIGHLIAEDLKLESRDALGYSKHDTLAENWLRQHGLPDAVCIPIGMHVEAKRYLVAIDKDYAANLSEASMATLAQQGGPFTETECTEFEGSLYFDQAICLRNLDELGKAEDFQLPPVEHWLARLKEFMSRSNDTKMVTPK